MFLSCLSSCFLSVVCEIGAVARISLEATFSGKQIKSDSVAGLLHLYTTPERRMELEKQQEQQKEDEKSNGDGVTNRVADGSSPCHHKRRSGLLFQRAKVYPGSDDNDLIDWSFDPFLVDTQVLHSNFVRMLELTGLTERYQLNKNQVRRGFCVQQQYWIV